MQLYSEADYIKAHKFCSDNKPALQKDSVCGCFHCVKIFSPKEITAYIRCGDGIDSLGTAKCPYCGVDSLIGESSGYPITEEFLKNMKGYWFKQIL